MRVYITSFLYSKVTEGAGNSVVKENGAILPVRASSIHNFSYVTTSRIFVYDGCNFVCVRGFYVRSGTSILNVNKEGRYIKYLPLDRDERVVFTAQEEAHKENTSSPLFSRKNLWAALLVLL